MGTSSPVVKMATALTADQLSRQLKDLKLELKESHHARELASAEKVCKEFFGLNLPVESEVLDLCAGSGIVSANIQSRGFINIDALDEDMPTLRKLQAKNLYRNYIWREVSGIGSTGIREESYDVVITAGGFSSHAMSPNDITEVLTILTGPLLWSFSSKLKRPWWTVVIPHTLSSSMMPGVRSSVMTWWLLVTTMGTLSVQRLSSNLVSTTMCQSLTWLLVPVFWAGR